MADLDERQKKAFDFVSDYTKQLITLATGIITFTVTFLGDEVKGGNNLSKMLLIVSWLLFIISVLAGIARLMTLTGNLDPVSGAAPNLTITSDNVRKTGKIQIFSFMLALFFSIVFGGVQLFHTKKKEDKEKTIIILQQAAPVNGKVMPADTVYPPVKPGPSAKSKTTPGP